MFRYRPSRSRRLSSSDGTSSGSSRVPTITEPQIFVESAFGAGSDGNHPWLHLSIEPLEGTGLGEAVFLVNAARRAQPDAPDSWSLLAFSLDEPMRAVRMVSYAVPATAAETGDGAVIAAAAQVVAPGCPVYWRQGPGHVYGGMPNAWCETGQDGSARQMRLDWRLTQQEMTHLPGGARRRLRSMARWAA